MPRLRITTTFSVLVLALSIAATGWLSTLTAGWSGPTARRVVHPLQRQSRSLAHQAARHHVHLRLPSRRPGTEHIAASVRPENTEPPPSPALQPLTMPADDSVPWYRLRGHMDGRVVVHVDTDGSGHVERASVVQSSGDPVLDGQALRSVRRWRFAVPADHPAGVSGDLPLHFSSADAGAGRAP